MFIQSLNSHLDLQTPAAVAARTTTGQGAGVDCQQYEGGAVINLQSAAGTGTTPTLDVKVQDSDDNSSFADVAGAAFTQVVAAASNQKLGVNLSELRRYVRLAWTIGGTTPSFTFGASLLAQKKAQ